MTKAQLAAIGVALLVASPWRNCVAADTFASGSDIAGVRLGMSAEEAKKSIVNNNPGAVVTDVTMAFGANNVQRKPLVGYAIDITSISDQQANDAKSPEFARPPGSSPLSQRVVQEGDFGHDVMRVSFDPNSGPHNVYGVSRYIEYPKSKLPIMDTVVSSFTEKYGRPSGMSKQWPGVVHMYWLLNSRIGKNTSLLEQCIQEGSHYNWPASDSDNFRNYDPSRDVSASDTYLINYILTPQYFNGFKSCGTVLDVYISPPNTVGQESDVSTIKEYMMDFPAANSTFKAYISDFWNEANGAAKRDNDSRAKTKPKL